MREARGILMRRRTAPATATRAPQQYGDARARGWAWGVAVTSPRGRAWGVVGGSAYSTPSPPVGRRRSSGHVHARRVRADLDRGRAVP